MGVGLNTDVGYTNPVIISNLVINNSAGTSLTFTWTTNIPASTKVRYGVYPNMDQKTPETDTSPLSTSHSVTINFLTPNTTYLYKVESRQNSGVDGQNNSVMDGYKAVQTGQIPTNSFSTPADLINVNIWLAADANVFQDIGLNFPAVLDGQPAAAWESPNLVAPTFVQAGGQIYPATYRLNQTPTGKPAVEFDSPFSVAFASGLVSETGPITFFCVVSFSLNTLYSNNPIIGCNITSNSLRLIYNTPTQKMNLSGSSTISAPFVPTLGQYYLFWGVLNGASSTLYNGTTLIASGDTGTATLQSVYLGFDIVGLESYLQGNIAEIVVAGGVLETDTINFGVANYLKTKYGL